MSLVPDYDDSVSSSTSDDDDSPQDPVRQPQKAVTRLPKPDFQGNDVETPQSSVFKNPFIEAENAKEAILQKHVKMVEAKSNVVVINGKKICWNYRKGRCRFGHNCKYAHDSDVQKIKSDVDGGRHSFDKGLCQKQAAPQPSVHELERIQQEAVKQKRKKRPGLTQGLVPGKKVMKKYANQKN